MVHLKTNVEQLIEQDKVFLVAMDETDRTTFYIIPKPLEYIFDHYTKLKNVAGDEKDSIAEFAQFSDKYMPQPMKRDMQQQGFNSTMDCIGLYKSCTAWGWTIGGFNAMVSHN